MQYLCNPEKSNSVTWNLGANFVASALEMSDLRVIFIRLVFAPGLVQYLVPGVAWFITLVPGLAWFSTLVPGLAW